MRVLRHPERFEATLLERPTERRRMHGVRREEHHRADFHVRALVDRCIRDNCQSAAKPRLPLRQFCGGLVLSGHDCRWRSRNRTPATRLTPLTEKESAMKRIICLAMATALVGTLTGCETAYYERQEYPAG